MQSRDVVRRPPSRTWPPPRAARWPIAWCPPSISTLADDLGLDRMPRSVFEQKVDHQLPHAGHAERRLIVFFICVVDRDRRSHLILRRVQAMQAQQDRVISQPVMPTAEAVDFLAQQVCV